jgi:hypothetical protein
MTGTVSIQSAGGPQEAAILYRSGGVVVHAVLRKSGFGAGFTVTNTPTGLRYLGGEQIFKSFGRREDPCRLDSGAASLCRGHDEGRRRGRAGSRGLRIAPTILLLLPPLALSLSSFPLSFLFLLLLPLAFLGRCLLLPPAPFSRCGFPLSFLFLLLLPPAASCKSVLCPGVSLVGGELVEARGLAIV